jgi:hypothetical protein
MPLVLKANFFEGWEEKTHRRGTENTEKSTSACASRDYGAREPRMLLKRQLLSEELGVFRWQDQKTKPLKTNLLKNSMLGYAKEQKVIVK